MKLARLRVAGFKTFVEPTEIMFEDGLSGVVGPNGCGKSNLVEALRWVMGENSQRNLRAAAMDDVIFSGSGLRPARSTAEVQLTLDNESRSAPAAFNEHETLEISRKIEREKGSTYRINAREVRARDVQILFADAATGARSHALVRQGQIGEIISAKPQARRRILEDAAGIAGLHTRRHEAELRLNASETNLKRVEDVLGQLDQQIEGLKRQARQAEKYRSLAASIRKTQALLALISLAEAQKTVLEAEHALTLAAAALAEAAHVQAQTATAQANAAAALPPLREGEAEAASALQRLLIAREALEGEERRVNERRAELERRLAETSADIDRAEALLGDAQANLTRLLSEAAMLDQAQSGNESVESPLRARLSAAEAELAASDARLSEAQKALAEASASRAAAERASHAETGRAARLETELLRVLGDLEGLEGEKSRLADLDAARAEVLVAENIFADCEAKLGAAREAHARAREAQEHGRTPLAAAEREAQRLETEANTLRKLLEPADTQYPPILDQVIAEKGFETALGAALGEDLDASTDTAAPTHWALIEPDGDAPLPSGVTPLSKFVQAPSALRRRLEQIGIVEKEQGHHLRSALRPGQVLVSREGDIWRWDGFTTAADAPSAAARRLAERNRLGDIEAEAGTAREKLAECRDVAQHHAADVKRAADEETGALNTLGGARRDVDAARGRLSDAERRSAALAAAVASASEARRRLEGDVADAQRRVQETRAALEAIPPADGFEEALTAARRTAQSNRDMVAQARAELEAARREGALRAERLRTIAHESTGWEERKSRASAQIGELAQRRHETEAGIASLEEAPAVFMEKRRALLHDLEQAEAARRAAADRLALAEAQQTEADRAARLASDGLATAREERARAEERLSGASERRQTLIASVREELESDLAGLPELAGVSLEDPLPEGRGVEDRLAALKQDRERLGGVNLLADEELGTIEAERTKLGGERDDLTEAIKRLRQAIASLNREGAERLTGAFDTVNAHFQNLFKTLFGGGSAELQLVESEDPLEAGLEIVANPPGKRPQTLSLLSGGEQALSATALIFAVFLTNPSPICVLDEVDAPLDDANVERFCDLVRDIADKTGTRFLVITHNPITMARMDRLYGVTMPERGVSQIVSVDLETAERFAAE
ncbi:MAG: chromosome segregation protein SMC [Hyphomicrobiales bacterium]|nr:chromosome segregation protein SMC [Hyphomicrobiales bacterium]